ncbi:hypothetical protein [Reinekea sp.]|jgi:hypothetical protein|uniref:hypothetical protein n=1 Tax=Reinekea sp. TaxID=1970455 RepID=UPI003989F6F7
MNINNPVTHKHCYMNNSLFNTVRLVLVLILLISNPSFSAKLDRINDFMMPISEHSEISDVQIDLILNNVDKPSASISPTIIKLAKELGVLSYLNFTYTWGDPNGSLLIDARIYKYPSKELALETLLVNFSDEMPEGFSKVENVGDFAVMYTNKTLYFVYQDLSFVLNTISEEVDLISVGQHYSKWLEKRF